MSPACVFAASIDEKIDKYFAPFSDAFSKVVFFPVEISGVKIPLVILFLLISSIIVTFYFRWIGIWGFKHSLKQIFGKKKQNLMNHIIPNAVKYRHLVRLQRHFQVLLV